MRPWTFVIGWGIPAVLTTLLLLIVKRETFDEKQNPNFQYGESQALVAAMVLVVCFIVTVGCLVMQQRYDRRYTQYRTLETTQHGNLSPLAEEDDDEENLLDTTGAMPNDLGSGVEPREIATGSGASTCTVNVPTAEHKSHRPRCSSINCETCPKVGSCSSHAPPGGTTSEIEDLVNSEEEEDQQSLINSSGDVCSPSKHPCDTAQRRHCRLLLERYRVNNQLTEPEEIGIVRDQDDEFQMLRHIVLLLLLSVSMFVGIALCLWTLIMEDMSGIYVELMFLDATFNFGQGFLTFLVFGFNTKMVVMPLQKWWRRLVYGEGSIHLPKWEDLTQETTHVCEQFLTYHLDKCVQEIVRDRRWRMESYTQVFCGHELVDWLLLVGLSRDRSEALKYGRHLLDGRVIRHVKQLHHFHDQSFFYTFLPAADTECTN